MSLYNIDMVAYDLGIVLQQIGCLDYVLDILDMREIKQRRDNALLVFSKQGLEEL